MRFSKLRGIVGLVFFVAPIYAHEIEDVSQFCGPTFSGGSIINECETPGQLCQRVQGDVSVAFVCMPNTGIRSIWSLIPASWPGESHEFALLFHDHDDAHDEIATMFGSVTVQSENGDTFSEEQVEAIVEELNGEHEAEIEQVTSDHEAAIAEIPRWANFEAEDDLLERMQKMGCVEKAKRMRRGYTLLDEVCPYSGI